MDILEKVALVTGYSVAAGYLLTAILFAVSRIGRALGLLRGDGKGGRFHQFMGNQRLRDAGKCFKVAIVACMRKLLIILNPMVRNQTKWRHCENNP